MSELKINYSQFSPEYLLNILRIKYHLPINSKCIFYKQGLNDIYKIITPNENYFLRISLCGVHKTCEIEEEINLILFLRSCGLPVVEPIALVDNSYVWQVGAPEGMRQAVMFRGICQNPTGEADVRMKNLGEIIAKMHISVRAFDIKSTRPNIDFNMLVQEPISLLAQFLMHRPDDIDFLNKTAIKLWRTVECILTDTDEIIGFCHGDMQPNNFFFRGENPVIFDFDCMGKGYFVYDLGVLLSNLTFLDNEIYQTPIWNSVIKGYCEVRPLKNGEKDAVYIFAALHMLRVMVFHAKLREQNQGAFYYMTEPYLSTFFGAYKRLVYLAYNKSNLDMENN